MCGEIEVGKCDICGKEGQLYRRYYHYDIQCECHSPKHFELIRHCKQCADDVKPPKEIKVTLKATPID